jgi:hypothetical protein
LDEIASQNVLRSIQKQIGPGANALIEEIKSISDSSLDHYLKASGRELYEIYSRGSWSFLTGEAGLTRRLSESEAKLARSIAKRLTHVDDALRIRGYLSLLSDTYADWAEVSELERRIRSMFFWGIWPSGKDQDGAEWNSIDAAVEWLRSRAEVVFELRELLTYKFSQIKNVGEPISFKKFESPLLAHATYSRYEILGVCGFGKLTGGALNSDGKAKSIAMSNEGAYWSDDHELDVLLVTLEKGHTFSPSTRFHDYAISDSLFHWESQNSAAPETPTGRRYLLQPETKSDVLIAVRATAEDSQDNTQHFKLLGLADLVESKGRKPMKITWRLRVPMDVQTYKFAAAVKVG